MLAELHNAIAAICPIDGISSSGRIDFKPEATNQQKQDARDLRDSWDAKTDAEKQIIADNLERVSDPDKADFRASINANLQTIDDYFAIASPTNAQHFAQMRAMSRVMKRVLKMLKKELL